MTHERARDPERPDATPARAELAVPGRRSRSSALRASKEPEASGLVSAGRGGERARKELKPLDPKQRPDAKRADRGHEAQPVRSEAAARASLMEAAATASGPIKSLVPGRLAPTAFDPALAATVEPVAPAAIGQRLRGAALRAAPRATQPKLERVSAPAMDEVAQAADAGAIQAAGAPGRPTTERVAAVKGAAGKQRAAVQAAKARGADEIADAASADPAPELSAVDDQEQAEEANLTKRGQVGAAKIDAETEAAQGAAAQGGTKAAAGGAGQAAQAQAADATKISKKSEEQKTAADHEAEQIREAAQIEAEKARAKGEADAAELRAKGQSDAAAARSEGAAKAEAARAQAGTEENPEAAAAATASAQQAMQAGEARANEILQQAEQGAQAAIATAARTAEDLLAKAEAQAKAVLDAATAQAQAAEAKQTADQGSLLSKLTASISEITNKVTATVAALAASATQKKAALASETDAAKAALAQVSETQRAEILQSMAKAKGQAATEGKALEHRAGTAEMMIAQSEATILATLEAQPPEARAGMMERYSQKTQPEEKLPFGLIDDRMEVQPEEKLPFGLIDDRTEVQPEEKLPFGLIDDRTEVYTEEKLPFGLIDDRMEAQPEEKLPLGLIDDRFGMLPGLEGPPPGLIESARIAEGVVVDGEVAAAAPKEEKKSWFTDMLDKHDQGQALETALGGVDAKGYEDALAKLPADQQAQARALEKEKAEKIAELVEDLDSGDFGDSVLELGGGGAKNNLKDELKSLPPAMREAVIAKMGANEDGTPSEAQERATELLKEAEAEEKSDAEYRDKKAKAIDNGVAATEAAVKAGNPAAVSDALDKLSGSAREKALDKLSPEARAVADEQLELREKRLKKAAEALEKAASGAGTDEIAIVKTLSGLSPTEAEELEEIYNANGGGKKRSLRNDLLEEFDEKKGKAERDFIRATLDGDKEAKDMSVDLTVKYIDQEASALINTDEDGINDLLRAHMNNPEGAKRIAEAYQNKTGKDLTKQLEKVMNEAELKESTAYVENDKDRANVAILEQDNGERKLDAVADAKEHGKLDKLVEDTEIQTGTKPTELLEDSLGKDGMAEVQSDLDSAQAKAKAKVDNALAEAKAKLEQDPKKYAETVQKMQEKAAKLHASLSSKGIGNDFETTELLRGLEPGEVAVLKEQFAAGDYGDLDEIVDKKLDGKDRKATKALLSGDKVQGALALVEQSADGMGTNVDAWKAAMETLTTVEDRTKFEAECKRQGIDYAKLNKSENSGYDRDMASALAVKDQDERDAAVAAVRIEKAAYGGKINALQMALDDAAGDAVGRSDAERLEARKQRQKYDLLTKFSNLGTNDAEMLDAEASLKTPRARELLDEKLKASTGKSVFEINDEETSRSTKKALDLYSMGDMEGGDVLRMVAGSEGIIDDDEDAMSKGFEGKDAATRERMSERLDKELRDTGRGGLKAWRDKELSEAQRAVAEDREKKGKVGDVAAMVQAGETTLGMGHDGAKFKELCAGKSPAEMEQFAKEFADAGHGDLYEFMRSRAGSAGEKRDIEILIQGNYAAMPAAELEAMANKDPQKLIDRVKALHEAAKGGVGKKGDLDIGNDIGNAMTDVYSDQGKILDKRLKSVEDMEKRLAQGETLSADEQAELIKNVKFMAGDQSAFTENKNKVVNSGAEVVGTAVEIGVTIGTGSDQAGTIAGGLTKMAVKSSLNGARYSKDEVFQEVGQLGVELLVGKAMDTNAAKAAFKNPIIKQTVEGALEGGLSAAVDPKALNDLGKMLDNIASGAGKGALSSLGSQAVGGAMGGKTFDTKRAAQIHGALEGMAEATVDAALEFDPDAPMLDQATSLLKGLLVEGAKSSHKGGKEHDDRVAEAKKQAEFDKAVDKAAEVDLRTDEQKAKSAERDKDREKLSMLEALARLSKHDPEMGPGLEAEAAALRAKLGADAVPKKPAAEPAEDSRSRDTLQNKADRGLYPQALVDAAFENDPVEQKRLLDAAVKTFDRPGEKLAHDALRALDGDPAKQLELAHDLAIYRELVSKDQRGRASLADTAAITYANKYMDKKSGPAAVAADLQAIQGDYFKLNIAVVEGHVPPAVIAALREPDPAKRAALAKDAVATYDGPGKDIVSGTKDMSSDAQLVLAFKLARIDGLAADPDRKAERESKRSPDRVLTPAEVNSMISAHLALSGQSDKAGVEMRKVVPAGKDPGGVDDLLKFKYGDTDLSVASLAGYFGARGNSEGLTARDVQAVLGLQYAVDKKKEDGSARVLMPFVDKQGAVAAFKDEVFHVDFKQTQDMVDRTKIPVSSGFYDAVVKAAEVQPGLIGPQRPPSTPEAERARELLPRLWNNAGQQAPFRGTGGTGSENHAATINQERYLESAGRNPTSPYPPGSVLSRTKADGSVEAIAKYHVDTLPDGSKRGRWELSPNLSEADREKFQKKIDARGTPAADGKTKAPEETASADKPADASEGTGGRAPDEHHAALVDAAAEKLRRDNPTLPENEIRARADEQVLKSYADVERPGMYAQGIRRLATDMFGGWLLAGDEITKRIQDRETPEIMDAFDEPKDAFVLAEFVVDVWKNRHNVAKTDDKKLGEYLLTLGEKGVKHAVTLALRNPESGKLAGQIFKVLKDTAQVQVPDLPERVGRIAKAAAQMDLKSVFGELKQLGARTLGLGDAKLERERRQLTSMLEDNGMEEESALIDHRSDDDIAKAREAELEQQRMETLRALLRLAVLNRDGEEVDRLHASLDASRARVASLEPSYRIKLEEEVEREARAVEEAAEAERETEEARARLRRDDDD